DVYGKASELVESVRKYAAVVGHGYGGERHAVSSICIAADGLAQHVYHPVGGFSAGHQRIQRPGGSPHDIASCFIVFRIPDGDTAGMDQRTHEAFADVVAGIVVGIGKILFTDMVEDIVDTG